MYPRMFVERCHDAIQRGHQAHRAQSEDAQHWQDLRDVIAFKEHHSRDEEQHSYPSRLDDDTW